MKFKKQNILALICAGIIMLLLIPVCLTLAQNPEEIKLITYYPAPYGDYKELRAGQLSIGEDYRNETLDNGELIVESKVGIGTSEPLTDFHLHDDGAGGGDLTAMTPFMITTPSADGHMAATMIDNVEGKTIIKSLSQLVSNDTQSSNISLRVGAGGDSSIDFGTVDDTTEMEFVPAMTMDSKGNFGIGTQDPNIKLSVKVPDDGETAFRLLSGVDGGNSSFLDVTPKTLGGRHRTVFSSGGNRRDFCFDSGRFGVATQTPNHDFDVNGGALFQGNHIYIKNPSSPTGKKSWGFVVNTDGGHLTIGQATDTVPSGGMLKQSSIVIQPSGLGITVQGKVTADEFDGGDIIFRHPETKKSLWRMFEDEDGLYLEKIDTGKVYRFVLEEVKE